MLSRLMISVQRGNTLVDITKQIYPEALDLLAKYNRAEMVQLVYVLAARSKLMLFLNLVQEVMNRRGATRKHVNMKVYEPMLRNMIMDQDNRINISSAA
jgi:transcriptional regulator